MTTVVVILPREDAMSEDKIPFLIKHRDGRRKMSFTILLLQQTVDKLDDPEPRIREFAENFISRRFSEEATKKYGEKVTIAFEDLLPPDPVPPRQPRASQIRSTYTR